MKERRLMSSPGAKPSSIDEAMRTAGSAPADFATSSRVLVHLRRSSGRRSNCGRVASRLTAA
jgi:hypothetical protein